MADTDITIKDSAGVDRKVDTRTVGAGTDEHREVVVIGDPATAAGTANVDATNGLDVDVTRVIPGTSASHLGKAEDAGHASGDTGVMVLAVANEANADLSGTDLDYTPQSVSRKGIADVANRYPQHWFEIDMPGIAAASYTSGDTFGTIIEVTNAARFQGGSGALHTVLWYDDSDVMASVDLMFYDASVTLSADNAAWSVSDSDGRKLVRALNMAIVQDFGAQRYGEWTSMLPGLAYKCASGATSLWLGCRTLTANGAPAVGSQRIRIGMIRD